MLRSVTKIPTNSHAGHLEGAGSTSVQLGQNRIGCFPVRCAGVRTYVPETAGSHTARVIRSFFSDRMYTGMLTTPPASATSPLAAKYGTVATQEAACRTGPASVSRYGSSHGPDALAPSGAANTQTA